MRKKIILLYISYLSVLFSSCGADLAMRNGDKFFAIGEYYDAAEQYRKAYTQTPAKKRALRGQRAKKMAECYRRINFTNKAITAYNNVVRYKQADSLTHLYLYLGQLYMRNGNYKGITVHRGNHETTTLRTNPVGWRPTTGTPKRIPNSRQDYYMLASVRHRSTQHTIL